METVVNVEAERDSLQQQLVKAEQQSKLPQPQQTVHPAGTASELPLDHQLLFKVTKQACPKSDAAD